MSSTTSSELVRFRDFLAGLDLRNQQALSPEEAVDLWRGQNPCIAETVRLEADLQEAIADMAAGDNGRPIEEIDLEIRARYFAKSGS